MLTEGASERGALAEESSCIGPCGVVWYESKGVVEEGTAPNTGLPAPVALLLAPNPCQVTAFAEKQRRKCRAQDGGFGNPGTLCEMG